MAIVLGENAYIDLATFKEWADSRNYDYSDYTDEQVEGAIVVASVDYIDVSYDFKGDSIDLDQPMQLPTNQVTIDDIVRGAAQAVWQQLRGLLLVDQSQVSQLGSVTMTKDKLDVLEEERQYSENSERTYKMPTGTIDRLLAPYVVSGGSAITGMLRV